MKTKSVFLVDFVLLMAIFSVTGLFLYRFVYSEPEVFTNNAPLIISEVKVTGGVGKASDEFVELYNPGVNPVILGEWQIGRLTKSASSSEIQPLFVFPEAAIVSAKGHVLVAHSEYMGLVQPDYIYTGQGLADDNTVALLDAQGVVMDLVGYGTAKNYETAPADAPSGQLLSLERKPGGELGNEQDTNNNQLDFFRTQPNPQNILSGVQRSPLNEEVPNEVVVTTTTIITVTSTDNLNSPSSSVELILPPVELVTSTAPTFATTTGNTSASVTVPVSVSLVSSTTIYMPGVVRISEVYPVPESGQNEFVELYNSSTERIVLTGWYLMDGGGSKTELGGTIMADDYLVIEKPKGNLNNTGDQVKVFSPTGVVIDSVSYGDWLDENVADNAPLPEIGTSLMSVYFQGVGDRNRFELTSVITKGQENQLSVVNNDQEMDEVTITPAVVNSEPKPVVKKIEPLYSRIIFPAVALVGEELSFDASYSSGGQGQRKYLWETGDGYIYTGEKIFHVYKQEGTYSLTLTLSDETGVEKHKTVKIKITPIPVVEKQTTVTTKQMVAVNASKTSVQKKESAIVYSLINDLPSVKTNTQVRIRGILAAVFVDEKTTEYYLIGETTAGGAAVGVLVKTKNTDFDARLGDTVEMTGKYIINATSGNYVQFTDSDKISIVRSGEVFAPVSSTIKTIEKTLGGFVQIQGQVVEKSNSNFIVADQTSEIKVLGSFSEIKKADHVMVIGYLLRVKEGMAIKIANKNDVLVKPTVPIIEMSVDNNESQKNKLGMAGVSGSIVLGLVVIKKYFFSKTKEIISATEN